MAGSGGVGSGLQCPGSPLGCVELGIVEMGARTKKEEDDDEDEEGYG